jgi:uncharacterized protein YcgL (UPF0745 family)
MSQTIATSTYRHHKKEATYLYLSQHLGWEKLPEALKQQFPVENHVIDFDMTQDRKLARIESRKVYEALSKDGYYLQLPPSDTNAIQAMEDRWVHEQEAHLTKTSAIR